MKRDAYEDEEPIEDFYDPNDNNMEIVKRSSGNFPSNHFLILRILLLRILIYIDNSQAVKNEGLQKKI